MEKTRAVYIKRWLRMTVKAIWSWKSLIIFILSFALAEIIWWYFFGLKKAFEQALENIVPLITGVLITAIITSIVQIFTLRTQIRRENNQLVKISTQKDSEIKQVSTWLKQHIIRYDIGISEAYLFGSITHNYYESHDIDVVLLFRKMSEKEYVKKVRKLTLIENEFTKTFNKKMHFQRFLANEYSYYQDFISKQSEPISILGGDNE